MIRAASRYEPRSLARTYLYGIALKLLAAERCKFLTSSTSGHSTPEPKTDGTPESVLWVRQALEKLDAPEREILMLREYEQLGHSEIAEPGRRETRDYEPQPEERKERDNSACILWRSRT